MNDGADARPAHTARVLNVLAALAKTPSATAKDLAEAAGIPVSTVYRLLAQLVDSGFVHKTSPRHYGAGPIAVQLAQRYRDTTLVTGSVTPFLRRLAEDSGELAAFMVVHGSEAVCVEAVESKHTLRCSYSIGASQPLLRGATATALLSRLSLDARRQVYDHFDLDPTERSHRESACAQAAVEGYAVSLGELDAGIWGVSAPVIDGAGTLGGTVTLMAPAERSMHRSRHLVELVRRTAVVLSGGTR